MTVAEAGRKGGLRNSHKHLARIAKLGGAAIAKRGSGYYSRIGRLGGEKVKQARGAAFFGEIAKKGGAATKATYGPDHFKMIGRLGGRPVKKEIR